jgi:methylglyoxal synthase
MKNETVLTSAKRIAVVASPGKRKELIEWSYYNKNILAGHELIATKHTANILEGTLNKPVYQLPGEDIGGLHELVAMIHAKEVDVIFFFENPMRTLRPDDTTRKLLDAALEMNIVIAGDRSNVDFMQARA